MSRQACTCIIITGFLFLVAVMAHAVAAPMTWPFYETSLTFLPELLHGPRPVPGFTPGLMGSLFFSDTAVARGSVDYSISCPRFTMSCSSTGDTDFLLNIAGIIPLPPPLAAQFYPIVMHGTVSIGTTPAISGVVVFDGYTDNLRMTIISNYVNGTIATDDDTLGGPDSQCSFTGIFLATEPGSIAMLTTALGLLVFRGRCARSSSRVEAG